MTLKLQGSTSGHTAIEAPASAGSNTLVLPPNNGSANQVLKTDGNGVLTWVNQTGGLFISYAVLTDQKANNTGGGTNVINSWTTRDLNTEVTDPDSIVSISSNKFELGTGNYLIKWASVAYRTAHYTTRIYDVTNSAVVATGMSVYAHNTNYGHVTGTGSSRLTVSGNTEYRQEYYSQVAQNANGLGKNRDTGQVETYSIIEIYKEA